MEMCTEEGASLQRGMNFRLGGSHSVFLMSVRKGAPYADQVSDDGQTLIYEGHNVPKSEACPIPQVVDQILKTESGALTQNGHFYQAAEKCRNGEAPPERVRVYEKIKKGIWVYSGMFALVDAWMEASDPRSVCKFKLELLANEPTGSALQDGQQSTDSQSPGRMIPTGVKLKVWDRDRGRCQFPGCGAEDELHFDHIVPFSKGGSSTTELNVQLLCARHNLGKSARIE
jgi:hypothetical protein